VAVALQPATSIRPFFDSFLLSSAKFVAIAREKRGNIARGHSNGDLTAGFEHSNTITQAGRFSTSNEQHNATCRKSVKQNTMRAKCFFLGWEK
jgi:hypothetical protein